MKIKLNFCCLFTVKYIFEKCNPRLPMSFLCHISTWFKPENWILIWYPIMCCFSVMCKADMSWASNSTWLHLMDLAISKNVCGQGTPSKCIFCLMKLGWNLSSFCPRPQVCSHRRSENEARCSNWLYYLKPVSLAHGRKRNKSCFNDSAFVCPMPLSYSLAKGSHEICPLRVVA